MPTSAATRSAVVRESPVKRIGVSPSAFSSPIAGALDGLTVSRTVRLARARPPQLTSIRPPLRPTDTSCPSTTPATPTPGVLRNRVTGGSIPTSLRAAAAIAGQNLGAKKPERAIAGVHSAARLGLMVAGAVGLAFFFLPRQLLAVFGMSNPDVITIGTQLLRVLSLSGLFITVALTFTGGLQGTGDTKSPLYISIISQVVIPLGVCFVIQRISTLQPIHIWIAILIGHATRCTLSVIRFDQGKWRNIRVE